MNYDQFAQLESSEKVLLARINASRYLKGFVLHTGSVYKLTLFEHAVISSIEESGTALVEVFSIAALAAGKYYNDRDTSTLYLVASDSTHPNGKTLVCIFTNFFANVPAIAPYNMASGFDVEWLPVIKDTSSFGVEIDNQIDQLGIAIDGKGSITFHNDKTYWASRFDKYYWENNSISIYSWNKGIAITQAKLLFRGTIQSKSYSDDTVRFDVADSFFKIRSAYPLDNLGSIGTYPLVYSQTLKRQVYGIVHGLKPQNIDQLVAGEYDIPSANTISACTATVVTFNNPIVYDYFRKDDKINIPDIGSFVVLSVDSTTQLTLATQLTSNEQGDAIGKSVSVNPVTARNYFNRNWLVAGHALYQPQHMVVAVVNNKTLLMDSTEGFYEGMEYFGAFTDSFFLEKTVATRVSGNYITFNNAIGYTTTVGASLKMSPVQNVNINKQSIRLGYGYDINAATGQMELLSEEYISPRRTLSGTITFTNGSATVTGVSSKFTTQLNNLSKIIPFFGTETTYQIVDIIDDSTLRLSAVWSGATVSVTDCEARVIAYFDNATDTLSCDCFGVTDDGLTTGTLLHRGPEIVADILDKAGLGTELNMTSFQDESEIANYSIGLVIPDENNKRSSPKIKDLINDINKSIFGVVIQNADFDLEYKVIRPVKSGAITNFIERDIIGFELSSDGSDIIKTVKVNYDRNEYNPLAAESTYSFVEAQSKAGTYLAKSDKTFELDTLLSFESDASIIASRLAFYLSFSRVSLSLKTKLQGASSIVGDVFRIDHRYLFERIGMVNKIKMAQAMKIEKDAFGTSIELDDLGNSFSSVCNFTDSGAANYSGSDISALLINGFFTDSYGMQGNDAETYGINVFW